MHTLTWIVGSSLAMSAIAWVGLVSVALNQEQLKKLLLPLVAFSAGSLLGGALLHLLPEAVAANGPGLGTFLPALGGFALFFLMEQFLSWHHGHSLEADAKAPVTYLILLADGVHNFIGGLAIGASFIVSTEVGVITWIAAAAHEVPQELGDFGILIRGGWGRYQALMANFVSAATIVPGALLAYYLSSDFDITFLLSFAAGNFIYIAASDLIPEVKHDRRLRVLGSHGYGRVAAFAFAAGRADDLHEQARRSPEIQQAALTRLRRHRPHLARRRSLRQRCMATPRWPTGP